MGMAGTRTFPIYPSSLPAGEPDYLSNLVNIRPKEAQHSYFGPSLSNHINSMYVTRTLVHFLLPHLSRHQHKPLHACSLDSSPRPTLVEEADAVPLASSAPQSSSTRPVSAFLPNLPSLSSAYADGQRGSLLPQFPHWSPTWLEASKEALTPPPPMKMKKKGL
jgi:hypothetical protein